MTRDDVTFRSGDGACAAWDYRPADASGVRRPIIVMAHGLAGVKEMRLDAFAERFAHAGYRCLVFDYRHFGGSTGEPRQLLDIGRQLSDWDAALRYARILDGVDPEQMVLWGTSFGGGHVLRTAARDGRVAAVIAQCPFTDGLASLRAIPPVTSAKVTALALRDVVAGRRGRAPLMVPSYGPPGATALMTAPDCVHGVESLMPPGTAIRSDVAARFALEIIRYVPGRDASRLTCPVHAAVCEHDTVAPARATLRHLAKAPRAEITLIPAGHFDIYVGEAFERNVARQLAFLERHLPLT